MTRHAFAVAGFAGLAVASLAQAGPLDEWNLIVRHDLMVSSETDGSALIGGHLMGTSNYAVQMSTATSGDGLAVGGNISAGTNVQVNDGNLRIGGTNFGIANLNGGGTTISDAPGIAAMIASSFAVAESASSAFAALSANGTLDGAGNMNAAPTLLGGQNVAVYDLMNADLQSLGQLNLNFGSADSVIINVGAGMSGLVDLIAPPNIIGGFSQANSSRILWNFYDATELRINNSFNGAIRAPFADLRLSGGGINGAVIVDNVSQMDAEIRLNLYTGYFIPAPGVGMAMLLGAGAMTSRRRR